MGTNFNLPMTMPSFDDLAARAKANGGTAELQTEYKSEAYGMYGSASSTIDYSSSASGPSLFSGTESGSGLTTENYLDPMEEYFNSLSSGSNSSAPTETSTSSNPTKSDLMDQYHNGEIDSKTLWDSLSDIVDKDGIDRSYLEDKTDRSYLQDQTDRSYLRAETGADGYTPLNITRSDDTEKTGFLDKVKDFFSSDKTEESNGSDKTDNSKDDKPGLVGFGEKIGDKINDLLGRNDEETKTEESSDSKKSGSSDKTESSGSKKSGKSDSKKETSSEKTGNTEGKSKTEDTDKSESTSKSDKSDDKDDKDDKKEDPDPVGE